MYCRNCGAQLPDDAKFCTKCGRMVSAGAQGQSGERTERKIYANEPLGQFNSEPQKEKTEKGKKKTSKAKRALLAIGIVLLCSAIIAGVLYFKWYSSPEQRIIRAMDAGNYEEALQIIKQDDEITDSDALIKTLNNRIAATKNDFANTELEYETAIMELSTIQKMHISGLESELSDAYHFIGQINTSRTHFNTAESFFENEKFAEAIKHYRLVIEEDNNYEKAKEQLTASVEHYREEILATAKQYVSEGAYKETISLLENALTVVPDDFALTQQLELYQADYQVQVKGEALSVAENYAKNADYLNALKTIAGIITRDNSDAELKAAYESYYNQYVSKVIAAADAEIAKKNYDEAAAVVNAGLKNASGDPQLTDKLNAINAWKPVAITSLNPINSNGWENWNEGSPMDPFGNDYSTASNYVIINNNWGTDYIEYRLYGKYSTLTGTIAPYTALEENASGYLQIYVDDELKYTSKDVGRKTDAFSFEIDVRGAEYVKIIVTANKCRDYMIISNVMLWPE